jgi:hypothetical protein
MAAHYVCVIFDDLARARAAYRALSSSSLAIDMDDVHMHYREIRDDKLSWSQTRTPAWALLSALGGGVLGMVIGGVAWRLGALSEVPLFAVLLITGLLCGTFGALGGTLLGGTIPDKPLTDALPMIEHGRVALVAEFDHDADAKAAETFLMSRGGVLCQKQESFIGRRLAS